MGDGAPFPFIVGCPRSGTTLLRLMLNAHPELAIPNESYFPVELRPWIRRYRKNGGFDLGLFAQDLATGSSFPQVRRNWELEPSLILNRLTGIHDIDYAEALRRLYALYAEVHGKPLYGDKTPWFVLHMRYLGTLFPEARFIHLIRDVRDVAPSLQAKEWGPDTLVDTAALWRHMVRSGQRDGQRLGAARYLEVRYEQLVTDPPGTLMRVCNFLGLSYRTQMLDYHEDALQQLPEHVRGLDKNLTSRPIQGLRDWRRDLDPHSISTCETVTAPLLRRLGYPLSHHRLPLRPRAVTALRGYLWSARYRRRRIYFSYGRNKFKGKLWLKSRRWYLTALKHRVWGTR